MYCKVKMSNTVKLVHWIPSVPMWPKWGEYLKKKVLNYLPKSLTVVALLFSQICSVKNTSTSREKNGGRR